MLTVRMWLCQALGLLLLAVHLVAASECKCERQHMQNIYHDGDGAMFVATIIEEDTKGQPEYGQFVHLCKITRLLKDVEDLIGASRRMTDALEMQVYVSIPRDTSQCGGRELEEGSKYIVQAFGRGDETDFRLRSTICSFTRLLPEDHTERTMFTHAFDALESGMTDGCRVFICKTLEDCRGKEATPDECLDVGATDECSVVARTCRKNQGVCKWEPPLQGHCEERTRNAQQIII